MDGLLKALAERNINVRIVDERGHHTLVTVADEDIRIGLTERVNRRDRELAPEEKRKLKLGHYVWNRYRYEPSGRLRLRIFCQNSRARWREWEDSSRRRLEDRLSEFIVGLRLAADAQKEARRQAEMAEQRREEARRREHAAAILRWKEEERFEEFRKQASAWHESRQLREYVTEVRRVALQRDGIIEPGSELNTWLAWASAKVSEIDPLGHC